MPSPARDFFPGIVVETRAAIALWEKAHGDNTARIADLKRLLRKEIRAEKDRLSQQKDVADTELRRDKPAPTKRRRRSRKQHRPLPSFFPDDMPEDTSPETAKKGLKRVEAEWAVEKKAELEAHAD